MLIKYSVGFIDIGQTNVLHRQGFKITKETRYTFACAEADLQDPTREFLTPDQCVPFGFVVYEEMRAGHAAQDMVWESGRIPTMRLARLSFSIRNSFEGGPVRVIRIKAPDLESLRKLHAEILSGAYLTKYKAEPQAAAA